MSHRLIFALLLIAWIPVSTIAFGQKGSDLAPVLYPLPQRTIKPNLTVTGVALPGERIGLLRNGLNAADTEANGEGDFSLRVKLLPGRNELLLVTEHGQAYGIDPIEVVYAPLPVGEIHQAPLQLQTKQAIAPVLAQWQSITEQNPVLIEGYANPGSLVRLFANGRHVVSAQADKDGEFQASIALLDGVNTIYASTTDRRNRTRNSNTIQLEYLPRAVRSSTVGGTLSQSATWTVAGSPYIVTSNLIVPAGLTLTIQAGVEVRFANGVNMEVSGTLTVQGTVLDPVILTSDDASPAMSDWNGINIQASAVNVTIDHAQLEWAAWGLYFAGGAAVISNSRIRDNLYGIWVNPNSAPVIDGGNEISANRYGIYVSGNSTPIVRANSIHSNSFYNYYSTSFGAQAGTITLDATDNWWGTSDVNQIRGGIYDYSNNTTSPVVDFSGFLDGAGGSPVYTGAHLNGIQSGQQTLAADDYLVLGDLNVPAGDSLAIAAGSSLRFAARDLIVDVSGDLVIQGTPTLPVLITANDPAAGSSYWEEIIVRSGASLQFDHVHISKGTRALHVNGGVVDIDNAIIDNNQTGIYFINNGSGMVSNSVIRDNFYGIYTLTGTSPIIEAGNEITANTYGVFVNGISAPVVRGNSIDSNGANFYTSGFGSGAAGYTLDATGNWWGSVDIATIRGKIYDHDDASTSPVVDFIGFLEAAGGIAALSLFDLDVDPQAFNPWQQPPVDVQFALNADSIVQLDIVRESDSQVVSISQTSLTAGIRALSWDGRDQSGTLVGDDAYRARLTAIRGVDNFVLDPAAPAALGSVGLVGAFPAAFNPYRNEHLIVDLNVATPSLVTMYINPNDGPPPFNTIENQFYPAGLNQAIWNGRAPTGEIINGGIYVWFPTPIKVRPNAIYVSGAAPRLFDSINAPDVSIKSDPYLITHSYEQFARVAYSIDQDAIVTFKLLPPGVFDPADGGAITLVNQQLQLALDGLGLPLNHVVEWRGHAPLDTNQILVADEGVYTFTIEAESVASGRSTLYRGVLQVRQ